MRGLTFPISGIPVRVDPSFWIIMGLFGLQRAVAPGGGIDVALVVEWVALVFVGILVHELGHAFSFRAFGRSPQVVLYAMGGLTSAEGRLTPGRRLISTLAGPGVGMLLGGLVYASVQVGLWDPTVSRFQQQVYLDLLFINIGWGVLNLLPLHPLDGGQSLEALLELARVRRAAQITSAVSIAVAAFGGYLAATTGQIFLLLIAFFLGLTNVRRLTALRNPQALVEQGPPDTADRRDPRLRRTLDQAEQALQQGRPDDAVEMLAQEHRLRPSAVSGQAYAAVLARTRRPDELEALLADEGERLGRDGLFTVGAALVAMGRYAGGLRAAELGWSLDEGDTWHHAVVAAGARAGMRDVDGAVRWLYTAADRGWDDRRRLEADPLFAEVRMDPRMADILQRMGV